MTTTVCSTSMDLEESRFSRWSFQISDLRYNPALPQSPSDQTSRPSLPSPPLPQTHPAPIEIELGVWHQDDDVIYASNWPPVQEYLAEVREKGQLVDTPSDIIFTLAALDVLNHPHDRAHWIFWSPNQYERTGNRVTAIAAHRPRLIKSKVSWLGTSSYRWVLHAIQQKFEYVHVRKQWYPVDHLHSESRKRTLRSNGSGATETPTVNEFFALDAITPKKPAKKKKQTTSVNVDVKRTKKPAVQPQPPTTPVEETSPAGVEQITGDSASPTRSSNRVRRKVTPTSRSPRIITAPIDAADSTAAPDVAGPSSPPLMLPAVITAHSRSTSQSSVKTLVESERSTSVISTETVVEASSSKKRKCDDMDKASEVAEDQEQAPSETEGMVTRGRKSKKPCSEQESPLSSRTSTPAVESPVKTPTRPRTRVKRARV